MKMTITEHIDNVISVEEVTTVLRIADFDVALDRVPYTIFENKGDLLVGTSPGNCDNFTPGANGQIIAYDNTTAFGIIAKTLQAVAPLTITDFVISMAAAVLNSLADVATGTLTDGYVLTYHAATGKWIAAPAGSGTYGYHPQILRSTNGDLTVNTGYCMIVVRDFTVSGADIFTIDTDAIMEVL